jgi:hypothetical protein
MDRRGNQHADIRSRCLCRVLCGNADAIADTLRGGGKWTQLADGVAAHAAAAAGKFVLGPLKGAEQRPPDAHGHVVVVVAGDRAHGAYPPAWWGSLGGQPGQDQTVNFAWTAADRDRVTYASFNLIDNRQGGMS